jgi:hypothetical protein
MQQKRLELFQLVTPKIHVPLVTNSKSASVTLDLGNVVLL